MKEACRSIINKIMDGKIKNKKDLEKEKLKTCQEYELQQFMSNALILENATSLERKKIVTLLRKKPTRTLSGVAVVAVMCRPELCPHGKCIYCPESECAPPSYTGEEPAALRARMFDFDPYKQVYNRLLQLECIGHSLDKVELIVMGGTFPAQIFCYQEWFVTKCLQAMVDFGEENRSKYESSLNVLNEPLSPDKKQIFTEKYLLLEEIQKINEDSRVRCVGITFETRSDYCKIQDVDRMLNMGVTRVELGVQTIYNFIYKRIERGHNLEDVAESARILRDSGIKMAMHLMPGLFAGFDRDMRIFKRLFQDERFKPDMLKIYPCLVTEGTKLHQLWKEGYYRPYSTKDALNLIVEIKKILPKWVRTMRIQRDIPSQLVVAGVRKSNLGELVYKKLHELNVDCKCIRCREVGHKASQGIKPHLQNIKLLKERYDAGEGEEIFLSFEDVKADTLIGFLRLRIPSDKAHRKEINDKTSLIRELHVYGPMALIGEKNGEKWQHKGYGEELLSNAEKIASEVYDRKKMLVTSGVGARNYYKKFGYQREGPYMSKPI